MPGCRTKNWRSWDSPRSCATCRACCVCGAISWRACWQARPDVFVGIDAPEFNLRVAAQLKAAGIPTVQYVSPQVWAWRQGRVQHDRPVGRPRAVRAAVRKSLLRRARTSARSSSGHPLADRIPAGIAAGAGARGSRSRRQRTRRRGAARQPPRRSDASSAHRLRPRWPGCMRAVPTCASSRRWPTRPCARCSSRASRDTRPAVPVTIVDGRAQEAVAAADAVLRRVGHRDARNRADQAADGRGLPPRRRSRPGSCAA